MAGNNDLEQRIRNALDALKKKPTGIQDDKKNPSIACVSGNRCKSEGREKSSN